MLKTIRVKGDCVESGGEKRELEFYDGLDIMGDSGRSLYSLRLLADGSLEISATFSTARHAGRLLDDKFVIRPEGAGRVTISRDEYRES